MPDTSLQVIPWQNVQAVWHHKIVSNSGPPTYESSSRHIYTVGCTDGTKITIGNIYQSKNIEQIGHMIEKETARYLFPAIWNSYQMGQPIVFGPLTVTSEGLSHQSHLLLWSEMKRIKIVCGTIEIKKHGKRFDWVSVKLVDVPNIEVFKRLVQHVTSEAARQLFPAILSSYQMGQPIVFGSLTVTPEGLSHGSRMLPWTRITTRSIRPDEISDSRLIIREPGKRFVWASVDLADVPQIEVFWMLVRHIRSVSLQGI